MSDAPTAVVARSLVKSFGDVRAIDGLDMVVDARQVHGLVGPNGAGKTTLLRILFGLVAPDSGSIELLGVQRSGAATDTMHGVGGFVEEPRFYPYLSARRNLDLLVRLDRQGDVAKIDQVLDVVRLTDRADRKVGGFSSGMRQRLGLAASLLRSPRLLLLDEPTVGLDPTGVREMLLVIKELAAEGVTVLVSSHNMTELEGVCDSITVMQSGRSVWDGSMDRLRAESPAPAHRIETSDDAKAIELARDHEGAALVADPDGWLTVSADPERLDAFVLALGRAGIAVRRLELVMSALESMFFALTGAEAERPESQRRSDEIGAVG